MGIKGLISFTQGSLNRAFTISSIQMSLTGILFLEGCGEIISEKVLIRKNPTFLLDLDYTEPFSLRSVAVGTIDSYKM